MHTSELELVPTRELIEELMRRQSFVGVVVHALEESRGRGLASGKTLQVRINGSLEVETACRLLGQVATDLSPQQE